MSIKSHGIMDDSQFSNVVIQLTDHLFEQGHNINRPLVIDAAEFVRMYAESWYEQGKNAGHAAQFAKDQAEGVEQAAYERANAEAKSKIATEVNPKKGNVIE